MVWGNPENTEEHPWKESQIVRKISKKLPNINFHLYGNNETIFNKSILNGIPRNVHFKGYFTYSELTKKINHYKILLMPYQQKVGVLIKKPKTKIANK